MDGRTDRQTHRLYFTYDEEGVAGKGKGWNSWWCGGGIGQGENRETFDSTIIYNFKEKRMTPQIFLVVNIRLHNNKKSKMHDST